MLRSSQENSLDALGRYLFLAAQVRQKRLESVTQPMQYVCVRLLLFFSFWSFYSSKIVMMNSLIMQQIIHPSIPPSLSVDGSGWMAGSGAIGHLY